MKKYAALIVAISGLTLLAMGTAPRYVEELRVGGGFGEASDGGLDIDRTGAVTTNGPIQCGGSLKTASTTFNLINDTATTLNLGGEANINLGGASNTVTAAGCLKVNKAFSVSTIQTFTNNDTTPSVAGANVFKIPSTWNAGNNVTALDDGTVGQRVTVIGGDADCVFSDANTLKLAGNWTAATNATLELLYDGSNWYEMGRSGN